ncbi:YbbR-like domain-containing protein [Flavicella sediminum]|uniref:hypothetical protein n=1 Tax=Flavicella sediminum TaxID=2585141 RepID=UPI00112181A8|nr:hypothetical protein [Flavicella sediminum]
MKTSLNTNSASPRKSKKQHVLLVFLTISTFFWFLTKLSKEYTSSVVYNLSYKNLPEAKLFQNNPPQTIALELKATGFKLLKENFNRKTLELDLHQVRFKEKYHYYILTKSKTSEIQAQLGKSIRLENIGQDSLFFDLGVNKFKKVPVVSDIDISYRLGYSLSDKILIQPDSIEVRGPEIQVDKIHELKLKTLKLTDVFEDVYHEVQYIKPANTGKVNFDFEAVKVIAKIDKFTEDSFSIPFYIENVPENAKITTYPKEVKVVFKIGLSNYSKISANSFKVVCDYKASEKAGLNYLVPIIVEEPEWVSSVKLVPNHIEYLIQK